MINLMPVKKNKTEVVFTRITPEMKKRLIVKCKKMKIKQQELIEFLIKNWINE